MDAKQRRKDRATFENWNQPRIYKKESWEFLLPTLLFLKKCPIPFGMACVAGCELFAVCISKGATQRASWSLTKPQDSVPARASNFIKETISLERPIQAAERPVAHSTSFQTQPLKKRIFILVSNAFWNSEILAVLKGCWKNNHFTKQPTAGVKNKASSFPPPPSLNSCMLYPPSTINCRQAGSQDRYLAAQQYYIYIKYLRIGRQK